MAINSDGSPTFFNISQPVYDKYLGVATKAQQAWTLMVAEFAAENMIMGITAAGKTELIGKALNDVAVLGSQGSLWQAYNALNNVQLTPEMAPYLTEERIQWMRNKMIQVISSL